MQQHKIHNIHNVQQLNISRHDKKKKNVTNNKKSVNRNEPQNKNDNGKSRQTC